MKNTLLLLFFPFVMFSQGYTSFFVGNTTNITTSPTMGICLMGGATENDNAMKWLLQRANGGDVVVLRTSGGSGYNNYFFSQLGVTVNSVETLLVSSAAGATNPYVLDKVANAEMIWFAGGDQALYVNYFKDNAMETALNNHINVKQAPIGGTSAGMAILSGRYFSALNGSVTTAEALANPYNNKVTLGNNDFLNLPFLSNVTTDTHFDNPDRRGRLSAFLARRATETGVRSFGISCEEFTAVCIDAYGKASVYGNFPTNQDFAYFVQANCQSPFVPETCVAGTPLTWNRAGEALKVYKVAGTQTGANFFEIPNWTAGSGGTWEHWSVTGGSFASIDGSANTCFLSATAFETNDLVLFPNPANNVLNVSEFTNARLQILNLQGQVVIEVSNNDQLELDVSGLSAGTYLITIEKDGQLLRKKFLKD